MALSTERFGLYNPDKPMENRLTDLGPRHFWQYFPPVIKNNYGKWDYHEILEPGVLVHVAESGDNWKPWKLFDGTPVEVPSGFQPRVEADGDLVLVRGETPIARMPKDGLYFDFIIQTEIVELLRNGLPAMIGNQQAFCLAVGIHNRNSARWSRAIEPESARV